MALLSNLLTFYKKDAVRSVAIYTFTNFFSKASSFLLLIVFTNPLYITPTENGLLSLFSNSLLLLMPFLSMGIIHSTSAEFFKLERSEFKNLFTTGFVLPIVVMILSAIILFIFHRQLQENYGFPLQFVWLIPLITFLIFLNDQLLGVARYSNDTAVYFKSNVTKIILELGISFVLVVFLAWRWEGRIAGILISYVLVGIYGFYYFFQRGFLFGKIKIKYLYSELAYALPIIVMQTSIFCMGGADRFFLSHYVDDNNETVGIYSVVVTFSSIMIILCTALLQYIFPKIYGQLSSDKVNYRVIAKTFWLYAAAMVSGMLLIMLFTPVAYHYFINEKYHSALKYIYQITAGFFLWTIAYFFYSFLLYFKEKKKIFLLSVCCIVISLSINYFFIKAGGIDGAATSYLVTYSIVLLLTLFFTRDYWKRFLFIRS